jgi:predicted nucleotidyltransferase
LAEADFLVKVKEGKLDYLTEVAPVLEGLMSEVEELASCSDLPDKVDMAYWTDLSVKQWKGNCAVGMREKISEVLLRIEAEHGVKIIYACESGSRAWGFASRDSDFDVRFIYAHPVDWYLSVAERRDFIEVVESGGLLDINGWDIRKTLQLLKKSNVPLMEWLASPIKYRCLEIAVDPLLELSRKAFLPEASFRHYVSMSKNSFADIRNAGRPTIKSYLYALRTMLCCKWTKTFGERPPMLIDELLSVFLPDMRNEIHRHIDEILLIKKQSTESAVIDRLAVIDDYLISQLSELSHFSPQKVAKEPLGCFDDLFREIIKTMDNNGFGLDCT